MWLCFSSQEESAKALKRPIKFTETTSLSETLNLIIIRTGRRKKLRLITPQTSETVADISFIANQGAEISVAGATFFIHRPEPCSFVWRTQGAFQCEIQQIFCKLEFQFRCEDKEYRLVKTACFKNEYAVGVVEKESDAVRLRKVAHMKKISKLSERFEFTFAEELSHEFVACVAYFLILSRSLDA